MLSLSQRELTGTGTRDERAIVQLSPDSRELLRVCKNYPWSSLFYLKTLCISIYISIRFSLLVKSPYSLLSDLE